MTIEDRPPPGPLTPEVVTETLGDLYARRVMATIVKRAKAVKDISQETGLPLATAYRQVNHLVEKGVVVLERSAITADGKRFDVYRSRIRAARIEMDGGGERVTWEMNEPVEGRIVDLWDELRGQVRRRG